MNTTLLILFLFFSASVMAGSDKPCLEAVSKYCNGVKVSDLELCLDKKRNELTPNCIKLLDARMAQNGLSQKIAREEADKKQKSLEAPIGKCLKENLICPDVVDNNGQKRKALVVSCPCHGDSCRDDVMCIDPKDEEKYAEDVKVSEGFAWTNYNQCLSDQQKVNGDAKKCDPIHPFSFKGVNIPKSDEKCENEFPLPPNSYGAEKVRYRMQVIEICSIKALKPEAELKCIQKQIPKSGYTKAIDNLAEASTQCDPKFKACKKAAASIASGKSKTAELLDQHCRVNPELSPGEIKCIANESRNGKEFQELNGLSKYLCLNEHLPCVENLQKNIKGRPKTADLKVIAIACKENKTEIQECIYSNFSTHAFAKNGPTFAKESEDVNKFCKIQNPIAKECVKKNYQSGLSFQEAIFVCKYATEEMRKCMSEFTQMKGEAAKMSFSSPADKLQFATEYCSYSDKKDQSCFISNYQGLISGNEHAKALEITKTRCHNFTQACYQNYNKLFPQILQGQLAGEKFSIEQICQGNNGTVESCVFKKILSKYDEDLKRNQFSRQYFGATSYPVDTYKKDCLKTFTDFLIAEMPGINSLEWKCDENKDTKKMEDHELSKYCDLSLYPNECDQRRMGSSWKLSTQDLREQCKEILNHKDHTNLEEIILRRCKIEGIKGP